MGFTNVVFVRFGTVVAMDMVQEGQVKSVFSNQPVLGGFTPLLLLGVTRDPQF